MQILSFLNIKDVNNVNTYISTPLNQLIVVKLITGIYFNSICLKWRSNVIYLILPVIY